MMASEELGVRLGCESNANHSIRATSTSSWREMGTEFRSTFSTKFVLTFELERDQ